MGRISDVDFSPLLFELLGLLLHTDVERHQGVEPFLRGILSHILRNLHGSVYGPLVSYSPVPRAPVFFVLRKLWR